MACHLPVIEPYIETCGRATAQWQGVPSKAELPEKPPTVSIVLHLIVENFNKHGRGRKLVRECIEAML